MDTLNSFTFIHHNFGVLCISCPLFMVFSDGFTFISFSLGLFILSSGLFWGPYPYVYLSFTRSSLTSLSFLSLNIAPTAPDSGLTAFIMGFLGLIFSRDPFIRAYFTRVCLTRVYITRVFYARVRSISRVSVICFAEAKHRSVRTVRSTVRASPSLASHLPPLSPSFFSPGGPRGSVKPLPLWGQRLH